MAVQRDKVIANAEKLVAKGKIEPAIKEYERLLDDNPNDVNTLNRIGDLWVRINRNDEAVKTFGTIADHYSKDGFFLKAIAIYKKINKLDPSKLEVYAKLADLYAKQGLAMEAKSQYQVLADYYLKHGDPKNALGIYRKISELDPNSINVHVKLADLYSQNNQTAEALKEYDRVGRMLLKRGMLEEAVQVFRKALKIDAKNLELVDSLVTALLEAKDHTNALQIVDTALESNRDHPRLIGMWGKIQIARGDVGSARTALEQSLAANPDEPTLRETLSDLYLRSNNADKALEMIGPLVDKALARAERGTAIEMLNRVLRVNTGHTPTLERLVGAYTKLNEETNILASLNSLAEAHIARGQYLQASMVLEKLIQREPANAQHRTKLTFVKSQMGGGAPAARPKTAHDVPMPAMEVEEPPPSFDMTEDSGISLDLDASEPIELGMSFDSDVAAPPPMIEPDQEISALEMEESSEDLDFITEHLTEAEVFAKYGLAEKAIEHLRAVIERVPKHTAAHDRLFRILLDEGDADSARAAANLYINVLKETGDNDTIEAVKSEFVARGQSFDAAAAPKPKPAAAKPAAAPTPKAAPAKAAPPPPPPPPVEEAISIGDLTSPEEISFDLDAGPSDFAIELEEEAPAAVEPEPEPEIAFAPETEPEPMLEIAEETELSFDEAPAAEETSFFGEEPETISISEEPPVEEIGEIDFYLEQELFDEARQKLDGLLERFPDNADLVQRGQQIDMAAASAAAKAAAAASAAKAKAKAAEKPVAKPAPAPPKLATKPPAISKADVESELLSAIPEDDDDFGVIAQPAPPPPAAPAPAPQHVAAGAEENLFADEDDFFDLAAELESELTDEEASISLSEEEQSLEEIFKEFKKGVEQQLDSEDYDTHYNLGIAYKEMGLIDEAIGEFQLASKDPKRAVECASMLGLCFLEKGMPQLAIKWYRKGLEMPEITEEEHIGLLYDLGSAHVEVGDTENAQKAFMEVYGMNTQYREIATRIKQLQDANR